MEPHQPVTLELTTKEELLRQLVLDKPEDSVIDTPSAELSAQAYDIAQRLCEVDEHDDESIRAAELSLGKMGDDVVTEMIQHIAMLIPPMQTLTDSLHQEASLAEDFATLKSLVSEIDPKRMAAKRGALGNLLAVLPGVDTPLARWSAKCRSAHTRIHECIRRINDTRTKIERDATTLRDDQRRMRERGFALQDYLSLANLIDQQSLQIRSHENAQQKAWQHSGLRRILAQRVSHMEQYLALNQQCVVNCELLIRNNRELIIGVDHALSVTVSMASKTANLAETPRHTGEGQGGDANEEHSQSEAPMCSEQELGDLTETFANVQSTLATLETFRLAAFSHMTHAVAAVRDMQVKNEPTPAVDETAAGAENDASPNFNIEIKED